jgi:FKBP-type peptidyl-prolyl cis-trans isomerase
MKYKLWLFTAILTLAAFLSCNGSSGSSHDKKNFDKDASYALGLNVGSGLLEDLNANKVYPDYNELINGIKDGLLAKKARFSLEEARERIGMAIDAIGEEEAVKAIQQETEFLAENARKQGITITPSGLQYEVLKSGSGPKPSLEDSVLVHYEGTFTDGRFFDSSYTNGAPATFKLDEIIPGWTEGIQLMSTGSKYKFYIPSDIGYGEEGARNYMTGEYIIPPYSTLIFEVELLEINPK